MTGPADDSEIAELAEELYSLYSRLGVPDSISFLDGGICFSWSSSSPCVVRYAEVPVDSELLHYLSRSARSGSQVDIYLDGNGVTVKGSWGEIWTRIYDVAGSW